jgi:hypothetical protein
VHLSGILNVVARALASSDTESAAMLQGTAQRIITTTRRGSTPAQVFGVDQASAAPDRVAEPASFITELRRQTTVSRSAVGHSALRRWCAATEL